MSAARPPRVLVTGGSIAGPAVAWGLARAGFTTTVLERAPRTRSAGQNVDVRGAGHDVLQRMGLRETVAAAGTGELGTRFVDEHGTAYATLPVRPGRDGATAEVEILRGELARLLVAATADRVEHRFGDHVVDVAQDDHGVDVVTASGRRERYDLLVIAEGKRSRTRDLVFGTEVAYRDRGEYVAYGTVERTAADDDWWRWMTAPGSRIVSLRPDNVGTMRATLGFLAPAMGLNRLDVATQLRILRERFADVGWQTPRILDGFAAAPEEFYVERAEQVRLSRWSDRRVVLVGDTAWAGPTGMGTSLALVGAHVLAGELGRELDRSRRTGTPWDPGPAHRAYEALLRDHVTRTQRVPAGLPQIGLPRSRWGVRALQGAHRLSATRALRHLTERALLSRGTDGFRLPDYPWLDPRAGRPEGVVVGNGSPS